MTDEEWSGLSKKLQEKLIAKHADCNVDYQWWDCIYSDFKEDAKEVGIRVDNVTFSGFYCQGGHAAFEGQVEDWARMFRKLGLLLKFNMYWDALDVMHFMADTNWGRYGMSYDCEFEPYEACPYDEDDDPLRWDAWHLNRPTTADLDELEKDTRQVFENLASTLYKNLEAEYEYLTSEESVTEYIKAHIDITEVKEDFEEFFEDEIVPL